MDWRRRNYYVVKISSEAREMRDKQLKLISKTIKFSQPYRHFIQHIYDGNAFKTTGVFSPSYMLSCRKEDSEQVEYILNKAVRNDLCSKYFKLTKEETKQ